VCERTYIAHTLCIAACIGIYTSQTPYLFMHDERIETQRHDLAVSKARVFLVLILDYLAHPYQRVTKESLGATRHQRRIAMGV